MSHLQTWFRILLGVAAYSIFLLIFRDVWLVGCLIVLEGVLFLDEK